MHYIYRYTIVLYVNQHWIFLVSIFFFEIDYSIHVPSIIKWLLVTIFATSSLIVSKILNIDCFIVKTYLQMKMRYSWTSQFFSCTAKKLLQHMYGYMRIQSDFNLLFFSLCNKVSFYIKKSNEKLQVITKCSFLLNMQN